MNTNWRGIKVESEAAGISLIGTPYFHMSAKELRQANPELADKWASFIRENLHHLAHDVAMKICAF